MATLHRLLRSDSPKLTHPAKAFAGLLMQRTRRFEHVLIRRDGYVLPFFSSSNVALSYWVVPDLVDPAEELARAVLGPGDVFVDVGANVGTVTAMAAGRVGPDGRVLAIEPHPRTLSNLRRTISANAFENVVPVGVACGAEAGIASLTDEPRKDDNNRIDDEGSGVPVPVTPLAEVLREHSFDRVALVKIDVEGFEGSVLRGLTGAFPTIEALYVEVIEANLQKYGDTTAAIVALLQDNGFSCFRVADDPTNLLALSHESQVTALGDRLTPLPGNPPLARSGSGSGSGSGHPCGPSDSG